jgi:hypothetical protein
MKNRLIQNNLLLGWYHRSGTGPKPPFKMKPPVSKDAAQRLGSEEEPQASH